MNDSIGALPDVAHRAQAEPEPPVATTVNLKADSLTAGGEYLDPSSGFVDVLQPLCRCSLISDRQQRRQ